jgi:hypothetical protein
MGEPEAKSQKRLSNRRVRDIHRVLLIRAIKMNAEPRRLFVDFQLVDKTGKN